MGRETTFTPERWATILEKAEEGEPLRATCRGLGIGKSAVYTWMADDPEMKKAYEIARREGYDAIADDCLDIADDQEEEPASRKVRIETRLKLLSKWYQTKYGDRQTTVHEDPHGNNPFASLMDAVSHQGRPKPGETQ